MPLTAVDLERRAEAIARRAAVDRLLNCWLRESGLLHPRPVTEADATPQVRARLGGDAVVVAFPGGLRVVVSAPYRSPGGHHRFGDVLWADDGTGAPRRIRSAPDLAAFVAGALSDGSEETDGAKRFVEEVDGSTRRMARYVERGLERSPDGPGAWNDPDPLRRAEQSLLLGHPFHPTPKSSEGFDDADLPRYAPELGASFLLHWLAASPAVVTEEAVRHRTMAPTAAVVRQASRRPGGVPAGWRLLPCHPWQARHLAGLPEVEAARARGLLDLLGPLGRSVHPTSSVRTVWDPEWNQFLKLPLDVRITNFVRVNTPEQVRRSMDASRAVDARRPALGRVLPPGFRILVETAVRAVRYGDGDRLQSSTAVLYREAPPTRGAMVVAGLLEPSPLDGTAPIVRIVAHAAACAGTQADSPFVRRWLARYTELSLVPLARLLAAEGLSLEAHPQNSLMAFRTGWPCGFVVRDLEGAAIRRDRALGSGLVPGVLAEHSPVLYDDPEPWRRLAYHVVVNHFGHLVATLAGDAIGEPELWAVVRGCLEREATRGPRHADATVVERLLDERTLPAKANLISRFRGRSEEPLYVDVPNPIAAGGTLG